MSRNLKEVKVKMEGKRLLKSILLVAVMIVLFSSNQWGAQKAADKPSQPSEATVYDYTRRPAFPNFLSSYTSPYVPKTRLANSELLNQLISGDKLNLSLADAVALAIENNLEIGVARYDLPIAQTDLLRAKAGGAARGVAGATISQALFGGALGTGVSSGGGGGNGNAGGALGGGIPNVGNASCCDPQVRVQYGWGFTVTPLNYLGLTGVPVQSAHTNFASTTYSQGFLTGTSLIVNVFGSRQTSNSPTQLFNPDLTSSATIGISQNLLNGFGRRANARFIRIAQNDQQFSRSVFRQRVIENVSKVISTYYSLLADLESIHVATEALGYAQKLLEDNQEEKKIGAAAQLDVAQAELDVANRHQDLLTAQNTFEQDSQTMKSLISRSFSGQIAAVAINPTDRLPNPSANDIPTLAEALKEGGTNRPEIEQAMVNLRNQEITIHATRNALLPTLTAFAAYSPQGQEAVLGTALGQVLRNNYPGYGYGVSLEIPIRNRQAQADAARALLEQRQLEMKLQQARNQMVWDVSKAVALVHQAQGKLEASIKVADLARQTYDMTHTKFTAGRATVREVITAQTQLGTAENDVVQARAGYARALVDFEQATGTLLSRHNIEISNAVQGTAPRSKNIPGDSGSPQP
ncbi:MAG TPA: TolC family protein [Terriglobia bacterium]|nr:TolC family protein [Terriglobia bacterium]